MDWTRENSSIPESGGTRLPTAVLRHILLSYGIGIGSRVLVRSSGDDELERLLEFLGIEAVRVDPSECEGPEPTGPQPVRRPRLLSESLDARADESIELAIVRDLPSDCDNLLSPEALSVTAGLLSRLRPGGCLLFLQRVEPAADGPPRMHQLSCLARHLSFFPGLCRVHRFPDRHGRWMPWNWMIHRQPRPVYQTASLRVPADELPQSAWHAAAERAASVHPGESCCHWALSADRQPLPRRRAA